jgi:cyclopropane fatty-acyl-phospholipid synthase-like methyltransferase
MATDPADYKRQTMHAYNGLAAEVVPGFDRFFETYGRLEADHLLAHLEPGGVILDLGCGAGAASCYFATRGYTPLSADLSTVMVRECRHRGLDRVIRLDLEALPFRRRCLDAIWAHTSLLHVPKARLTRALEGLQAVLRPGGAIFIALIQGAGEGYQGQPGAERWFSYFEAGELESYLPAGLTVVRRSRTERKSITFLGTHLRNR